VESNRDAFGASVILYVNGNQHKQSLISGQGYFSSNAKELYFGLGKVELIDKIEILWPNGIKQSFKNIKTKQTIYILEGEELFENTLTLKK